MYAHHIMRKWKLANRLMYYWLPAIMLLVIWCQGAVAMHLTPLLRQHQQQQQQYLYDLTQLQQKQQQQHYNQHYRTVHQSNKISDHHNHPDNNHNSLVTSSHNNVPIFNSNNNKINYFNNLNNNDKSPALEISELFKNNSNYNFNDSMMYSNKNDDNLNLTERKVFAVQSDNVPLNRMPTERRSGRTRRITSYRLPTQPSDQIPVSPSLNDRNVEYPISKYSENIDISNVRLFNERETKYRQRLQDIRNRSKTKQRHIRKFDVASLPVSSLNLPLQAVNHSNDMNNNKQSILKNDDYYKIHYHHQQKRQRRNSRHSNNQHFMKNGADASSGMGSRHLLRSTRRPRRYCSARDPATLAFEAPTVFEGKIRSMSSDRRKNFSVTFEVKEVYKRQPGFKMLNMIRLQFTYRNTSECDIYRESLRSRGFVRDELEPGKEYLLFVKQIDVGNYTILGQPIRKTRKAVNDIRLGVSKTYGAIQHNSSMHVKPIKSNTGQRAIIESLIANNQTAREGKRLRLVCKVRGQPPPKVTWFKDGRSIGRNRAKYTFTHFRRRSELAVKSVIKSDAGQYECRAKNKVARQPVASYIRIEVLPKDYEVSTPLNSWSNLGTPCPVIGDSFCLNGGTCVFFKDVGEPACRCPDGFLGNRCETKNPTNLQPSTYTKNEQQQCGEKFYGSYYC